MLAKFYTLTKYTKNYFDVIGTKYLRFFVFTNVSGIHPLICVQTEPVSGPNKKKARC